MGPRRPPPGLPRTLAGWAEDAAGDEVLEPFLELGGDLPGDRLGVARALGLGARGPALQVRVALRGALPHGDGVDQVLEALGERDADGVLAVHRLHQRGKVTPLDDPVSRHRSDIVAEADALPLTTRRPPVASVSLDDYSTATTSPTRATARSRRLLSPFRVARA